MLLRNELVGEKVTLKSLVIDGADGPYSIWMQDPEVLAALEARHTSHDRESLRRYIEAENASDNKLLLGIYRTDIESHIGNIKLNIDPAHHRGDIGIIIGEKSCWGRGYAGAAIALMVDHAFHALGLHKLTAGCYASNPGSERAFINAGFTVEARRPAHYIQDGQIIDGVFMGLVNWEAVKSA